VKCQNCGLERAPRKGDVIDMIEAGHGPTAIARELGCSRTYVQQLHRELLIVHATAQQLKLTFTTPFQVSDRN
jgi:hypothetical protein